MSKNGISNWGKGKTKQSSENETNINKIIKRNIRVEQQELDLSQYMDVSETPTSLQECFQRTIDAQEMFEKLPSEIRLKMMNDPANLETYLQNSENWPELERLGLIKARKIVAEGKTEVTEIKPPAAS